MRDREIAQYVITHYTRLQGLRLVPLGVPFLLSAAWRARWLAWWPGTDGRGAALWFFGLLGAAIAASFPIRAWYEREFGLVVPRRRDNGAGPLVAFVALVGLATWYQMEFAPPIMLPLLIVGLILGLIGWRDLPIRAHYLALAAAFAAYATAPLVGVPVPIREILFDLLVGVALIVAGVGDHRALAHAMSFSGGAHARAI